MKIREHALALVGLCVIAFTFNTRAEYTDDCITFSSEALFTLSANGYWAGMLFTSVDKTNWTCWTGDSIAAAQTCSTGPYNLYVRGNTHNTRIAAGDWRGLWVLTGSMGISCSGNIETLRGASGDQPSPTPMDAGCYQYMFYNCRLLTSAPSLPATNLSARCYQNMFLGCTSLIVPPSLPAETLKIACYACMFEGCESLMSIPTLPATKLATGCYEYMFSGCKALEVNQVAPGRAWKIPIESTTISNWGVGMFKDTAGILIGQPELNTTYFIASEPKSEGGPYTETKDGIEWTFMVDANLNASVGSGTYGGARAVPETTKGAIVIPSTLGGRTVTRVGYRAFNERSGLTSVVIPSGVTSIGDYAFGGCSGLTALTIPANVTTIGSGAFQECSSLIAVTLNDGLKTIGSYAFRDCLVLRAVNIPQSVDAVGANILSGTQYWKEQNNGVVVLDDCALGFKGDAPTQLVIPNGVRVIASLAFYGCSSSSVSLPNSLRTIGGNAFQGSKITAAELPMGVKTICGYSFCNCGQLTRVVIPSSVRDIEEEAFMSCSKLATLDISEGVERIGNNAFYECKALTNVSIPDSVESIGDNAFFDCTGLWTVEIGSGIKSIGGKAFEGCTELQSFGLYGAPTNLGIWAFGGYGKDYKYLDAVKINDLKKWCANELGPNTCLLYFTKYSRSYSKLLLNEEPLPADLSIPIGVSRVGARTFQYLPLTSVSLSSNVSSIGNRAFSSCLYLTNAFLNAGLKAIEDCAFMDCSRLERITIPLTVESIGTGTFSGCSVLNDVDFECPPPNGIKNAAVKGGAAIRYNVKYETEWLAVISECGWTNATPYKPDEGLPDLGDNPTQEQIQESLKDSKDDNIKSCITNVASYNAYRVWAMKIGPQTVKGSPNAWVSFVLGSDKLLDAPPTDEDLTVEEFEPSSEAGKFDFTVKVDGVNVGSEAQKENLKQVFGLEGSTTLDPDEFSAGNVDLTFDTPKDGKVKFTAGPKDGDVKTFYMKVKVNP